MSVPRAVWSLPWKPEPGPAVRVSSVPRRYAVQSTEPTTHSNIDLKNEGGSYGRYVWKKHLGTGGGTSLSLSVHETEARPAEQKSAHNNKKKCRKKDEVHGERSNYTPQKMQFNHKARTAFSLTWSGEQWLTSPQFCTHRLNITGWEVLVWLLKKASKLKKTRRANKLQSMTDVFFFSPVVLIWELLLAWLNGLALSFRTHLMAPYWMQQRVTLRSGELIADKSAADRSPFRYKLASVFPPAALCIRKKAVWKSQASHAPTQHHLRQTQRLTWHHLHPCYTAASVTLAAVNPRPGIIERKWSQWNSVDRCIWRIFRKETEADWKTEVKHKVTLWFLWFRSRSKAQKQEIKSIYSLLAELKT